MLFIHGTLEMGGVETFFVRMAKERKSKGLKTSILLLKPKGYSHPELIAQMERYAYIYYSEDLFINFPFFTHQFILLAPAKKEKIIKALKNVDQIHTYGATEALLGQRLLKIINSKVPITIGFYHYNHYLWGDNSIPHYIKLERNFVFNYLPKEALLFFSKGNRDLHTEKLKINFENSQVFRLGVVDKTNSMQQKNSSTKLKIVTVGRLVAFKSYNLYMLDVIKKLRDKGSNVSFDIYGYGPLEKEMKRIIRELNISEYVTLHGQLDYSKFDETVLKYDVFIGSGTAIIQAAALGIPSIVGIEYTTEPKTYGYFADVHQYEYNLKGLDLPLIDISKMIEKFIAMNEADRLKLKNSHTKSIQEFTNASCQNSMNSLKNISMPKNYFKFNPYKFELSRFFDQLKKKLNKKRL